MFPGAGQKHTRKFGGQGSRARRDVVQTLPAPIMAALPSQRSLCPCGCGLTAPTRDELRAVLATPSIALKPFHDTSELFSIRPLRPFLREKGLSQADSKRCWGCEVRQVVDLFHLFFLVLYFTLPCFA